MLTALLVWFQGIEDHMGDMDFKLAGSKHGVTALQVVKLLSAVGREFCTFFNELNLWHVSRLVR